MTEACIVGWAHSPFGRLEDPDIESLIGRVAGAAIEDAGIPATDIDAIMARLVTETARAGLSRLKLETGLYSAAAIEFYRRQGFRPCGPFAPYTAMPPEAILTSVFMEMPVGPSQPHLLRQQP